MTIKLALIGAGRIANVHAKAIAASPDAQLVAVTDPVAKAAEALADKFGCKATDPDAIANDKDVDGVLICTPTDTHADLIEKFAKAGKHVFCEKPVDLDLARAEEVVAIAKKAGVKLMLGFNRRYDPNFAGVRAAIDEGQIGAVEIVSITSRDPGAPDISYASRSGGIFRDMTIHDLDMARFMLGEEPVLVSAHASVLVKPELKEIGDFDSATVILETASGRQAVINNSRRANIAGVSSTPRRYDEPFCGISLRLRPAACFCPAAATAAMPAPLPRCRRRQSRSSQGLPRCGSGTVARHPE